MNRFETSEDPMEDCITITDNEDELKSDFGSEIVLYPLDDAKIVVDKLNWYELFVQMLKENLEYEGWTEDDFKGLIEDIEANLE